MLRSKSSFLVTLCLLPLLAACDEKQSGGQGGAGAFGMGGPVEVGVVVLQPETVTLTAELPGRVTAFKAAEIRPQVGGIILERNFEEGAIVQAGQQLYQIDPALYQAAYNTALAQLKRAQASLRSASLLAQRYKSLITERAVSKQEYDDARAAQDQAAADVAGAQAAVDTAKINLEYTKVLSPITGRIGKSSVTAGALVTANQAIALALVQQLDPVYVDLTQSSQDALRLRDRLSAQAQGAPSAVELTLDATGQIYNQKGTMQFSDITVDTATGNVQLRAQFPNPEDKLLPGLFVRAKVDQGQVTPAFLVPQQAVVRTPQGQAMAWVVDGESKAQMKPVVVEQAIGDKWVVTNGLSAGDRAIIEGAIKIQPGAAVQVVDLTPKAPVGEQPTKQIEPATPGQGRPEVPATPIKDDKQAAPAESEAEPSAPSSSEMNSDDSHKGGQ